MNDLIYSEIINISSTGITLKHKGSNIFVSFKECTKNYAKQNSLETSKCVAVRDITSLTFTFYTNPKIKLVFKKNFFKNLFSGKSAVSKFLDLERAIKNFGFTSYDLS